MYVYIYLYTHVRVHTSIVHMIILVHLFTNFHQMFDMNPRHMNLVLETSNGERNLSNSILTIKEEGLVWENSVSVCRLCSFM